MIISNCYRAGFPQHKFCHARLCWWSDDWMVYHLGDDTSKQDKRATLKIRCLERCWRRTENEEPGAESQQRVF
jgi:hypothetical protein